MVPAWSARVAASLALALLCQQVPSFRSSTDVVVVDVQVATSDGKPIGDLTTADFSLTIDGKSRAIQSVVLDKIDEAKPARRAQSRNTILSSAAPFEAQSYVLILADPSLMRADASRDLFDQAARFVDELPAAHAVAFQKLPATQVQFPFSTNRAPVVATLRSQLGALNINTKLMRSEGAATIDSIAGAIDLMSRVEGRRTIVLLIDVLPDEERRLERLGQRAADANVTIHTIATGTPAIQDLSRRRSLDPAELGQSTGGAGVLADLTGGLNIIRGSSGTFVMPRIAQLLSQKYLLAFAVESSDRDGKSHKVEVRVRRDGADVRARRSFIR